MVKCISEIRMGAEEVASGASRGEKAIALQRRVTPVMYDVKPGCALDSLRNIRLQNEVTKEQSLSPAYSAGLYETLSQTRGFALYIHRLCPTSYIVFLGEEFLFPIC